MKRIVKVVISHSGLTDKVVNRFNRLLVKTGECKNERISNNVRISNEDFSNES